MNDKPFFRRPQVQFAFGLIGALVAYIIITASLGGWSANLLTILLDTLACILALLFWLVFFAQFVLPVNTLSDRLKLLERFVLYFYEIFSAGLLDIHGPAIFVKNGNVIQKERLEKEKEESQERGLGVIWLDTASAAVLRNPVKFTRSVGPGVVFTNWQEYLAGTVDLHTQRLNLGPHEDENPFAPKPEGMAEEKFQDYQNRIRWSTSGLTRDGIEVVPHISVVFKIDAEDKRHEGGTYFGYNQEAVFKAITNEGVNPNLRKDGLRRIAWNELPGPITVDLWREYLRKFTLSQLFETLSPADNPDAAAKEMTALQYINEMINERLKKSEAIALNDFGLPTGQKVPSREYLIMKESGIRIFKASIKQINFADSVEDQLVRQWTANWLETARKEREQVEQKRSLEVLAGLEDARKEFSILSSQEISKNPPKTPWAALEQLLRDTRTGVIRNASLHRRLGSELDEITALIQWVGKNL